MERRTNAGFIGGSGKKESLLLQRRNISQISTGGRTLQRNSKVAASTTSRLFPNMQPPIEMNENVKRRQQQPQQRPYLQPAAPIRSLVDIREACQKLSSGLSVRDKVWPSGARKMSLVQDPVQHWPPIRRLARRASVDYDYQRGSVSLDCKPKGNLPRRQSLDGNNNNRGSKVSFEDMVDVLRKMNKAIKHSDDDGEIFEDSDKVVEKIEAIQELAKRKGSKERLYSQLSEAMKEAEEEERKEIEIRELRPRLGNKRDAEDDISRLVCL